MEASTWSLRKNGDGALEIGDGIENAPAGDHGDSHVVNLGVEQIGAVVGGVHPFFVNAGGGGANGYVLFNQAEMGTRLPRPLVEIGLASVAVGDGSLGCHAQAVLASSR